MSVSCYHCRIVASHIRGRTYYVTAGLYECCSERCTLLDFLASQVPPSYAEISSTAPTASFVVADRSRLRPRVAVVLGVNARWHIPLLICRALSTAPAAWWGLRCAFTFLAELLFSDGMGILYGDCWTVEKRFRVTEVFLAILWVGRLRSHGCRLPIQQRLTAEVLRRRIFILHIYRLSYVSMVCLRLVPLPKSCAYRDQASVLHTICHPCQIIDDEHPPCLYHILDVVPIRCLPGSAVATPGMDIHCHSMS